ncbi:MAG: SRPBCC family protein [Saprospiraceae bacterium]
MNYIFGFTKFLFIIVVVYLFSAFFAKSNFKVERTRVVQASQKLVYNQIGILKNWENWSAWQEKDQSIQFTFEGKDAENGAVMHWKGDPEKSGAGLIEIVQADPPYSMVYKLKGKLPFELNSKGSFILSAENSKRTTVLWTDHGQIPFLLRPVMMFNDVEAFMAPDIERGLFKVDSICSSLQNQIQLIIHQDSLKN